MKKRPKILESFVKVLQVLQVFNYFVVGLVQTGFMTFSAIIVLSFVNQISN